jgi:sulfate adenylyltransferase large subunit
MLRFITAGSVDDGKSTLIGRLLHDSRQILADQLAAVAHASRKRGLHEVDLSLLTDGLEAEREQGITIDVAYRYFATPRRKFIIADTPGHEQYTRNMATGASTADAAVILADATKGLLAQGRRHLYLAQLLGIRHLVVAVNKLDLAGYRRDAFDAVRIQFEEFTDKLGVADLRFIPMSALRGDMVVERGVAMPWYEGPTLLELLESLEPERQAAAKPFRFPVQLVQRANGSRACLGRIVSGRVRCGDEILVLPSGRATSVKAIRSHEGERGAAAAGESVALALAHELDVARGALLAPAAQPPRGAGNVEAKLVWLGNEPLDPRRRYALRHTTRTVKARVASVHHVLDMDALAPGIGDPGVRLNDIARVEIALQQPVFFDSYRENRATGAFILVDEASHQTLAAGMFE